MKISQYNCKSIKTKCTVVKTQSLHKHKNDEWRTVLQTDKLDKITILDETEHVSMSVTINELKPTEVKTDKTENGRIMIDKKNKKETTHLITPNECLLN